MKIVSGKVIVCCPGRNFVTLKLVTDQGLHGLGDATLNGRERAVATYLEQYCVPALIGMDARNIEDIWQYFYRGVYWRRGAVTMAAVSAIDMALWDLKGKALNTPVYNLIGGKSRERVLVYAHASGEDVDAALEDLGAKLDLGFRAVRIQAGVTSLDAYGVARGGEGYEPARPGMPSVERSDTAAYLRAVPKLFERARAEYGEAVHLLHDAHHRCTPIEAARLAKELEPYHLFWLEDAVSAELQASLSLVRQHSTTPLAIGEVFNSIYDYTTLLSEQLIDYVRMPVAHGGGITHALKVASFAAVYHAQTGFHGATDLSPVSLAAALHVDTAVNNFGIQEYMPHSEPVSEVFQCGFCYDAGALVLDETPGLGVDFDEAAAAKYPYDTACLPVNRKLDGTLFNW